MSHTTKASRGTTFTHNGDYSGNVRIIGADGTETMVPFADLRELVFSHLRDRITEQIEQASDDTLEQMLTSGTGVSW